MYYNNHYCYYGFIASKTKQAAQRRFFWISTGLVGHFPRAKSTAWLIPLLLKYIATTFRRLILYNVFQRDQHVLLVGYSYGRSAFSWVQEYALLGMYIHFGVETASVWIRCYFGVGYTGHSLPNFGMKSMTGHDRGIVRFISNHVPSLIFCVS